MRKKLLLLLVVVLALPLLTRCGLQSSLPPSGTFSNVYQVTLRPACIACHAPGLEGPNNGVAFNVTTKATAYQTLVGPPTVRVTGFAGVGTCGSRRGRLGAPLVLAGSAAGSYLAAVLFPVYNVNNFGGITGCQPISTHHSLLYLSTSEQTSIVNWITAGARND